MAKSPKDDKNTLKGQPLNYNVAQQQRYTRDIKALVAVMIKEVESSVVRFFNGDTAEEFFEAMDASVASQAKIMMDKLKSKFDRLFDDKSKPLAEKMVKGAARTSAASLSSSLKEMSSKVTLKTNLFTGPLREVIKSIVSENVGLIKSIGEEYLHRVNGQVMRSITTGSGLKDLIPALRKYKGITDRRAKFIALDQTRKAYSFINKERMEELNVGDFEWVHSGGGQHPRKSHQSMNGKVYSLSRLPIINADNKKEAPVRGIPGQAPGCRCIMRPVYKFEKRKVED